MPPELRLTTPLVWMSTSILLGVDIILAMLARRFVDRRHIHQMRWRLAIIAGLFFLLVWSAAMLWGWDWFYVYIFPNWARTLLPPMFGVGYTLLALGMTWLCLILPVNPAVTWCFLGGLEGLFSHIYAIYSLGAASKPPIMQGTDPFAVLIFAIFEKAFYWSMILLFGWLTWRVANRKLASGQFPKTQ